MLMSRLLLVLACTLPVTPLAAHEYWIEPEAYQLAIDDNIRADFKNGQNFKGINLSFFDRGSQRFDQVFDGRTTPVNARSGDIPALQLDARHMDGLLVVVLETTPARITYTEWQKFLKFAAHKDFPNAATDHAANGWSREKFTESYSRHAKALIAIGTGQGKDTTVGLTTEFTALTNPYLAGFDGQMKVALSYQGQPRADAQIEVFDRAADDSVAITLHRTDSQGHATIPVKPGHAYLFDAVMLRPAPDADGDPNAPVWQTFWAALTFAVPQ